MAAARKSCILRQRDGSAMHTDALCNFRSVGKKKKEKQIRKLRNESNRSNQWLERTALFSFGRETFAQFYIDNLFRSIWCFWEFWFWIFTYLSFYKLIDLENFYIKIISTTFSEMNNSRWNYSGNKAVFCFVFEIWVRICKFVKHHYRCVCAM